MKTKHLLLSSVMLLLTALTAIAQDATEKKFSVQNIPFGKKLPPPDLSIYQDKFIPQVTEKGMQAASMPQMNISRVSANKKTPEYYRQLLLEKRKMQISLLQNAAPDVKSESNSASGGNSVYNFHLVKDINALSESNPHNYTDYYYDINNNYVPHDSLSFAVLDNVIYFVADDGIHGNELWRSDGSAAGTFLLKDIQPDAASSNIYNIVSINSKIYFSAGSQLWVSDGTESGTQSLDVYSPTEFFLKDNKTYFITDGFGYQSAIWTTNGTIAGTNQVIDIGNRGLYGGEQINQVTLVNGDLFFSFLDYESLGWQIWRSDLTDAGTYHVSPSYPAFDSNFNFTNYSPAQLTNYNNKLYYSANDGTGRELWVSDGTDAGTKLAPGNHGVIINADFLGTSFPIVNNILFIPGERTIQGNGLYI